MATLNPSPKLEAMRQENMYRAEYVESILAGSVESYGRDTLRSMGAGAVIDDLARRNIVKYGDIEFQILRELYGVEDPAGHLHYQHVDWTCPDCGWTYQR